MDSWGRGIEGEERAALHDLEKYGSVAFEQKGKSRSFSNVLWLCCAF